LSSTPVGSLFAQIVTLGLFGLLQRVERWATQLSAGATFGLGWKRKPVRGKMSDKRQVVSAPMSLNGSYLRTVNLLWFDKSVLFRAAVGWWLAASILFFWWGAVVVWYVLFGLLLVPYRLIRRGGRNRKIAERRHQELIQALKTPGADKSALAEEIVGSSDNAEGASMQLN